MRRLAIAEDEELFRRELESATPWEDWGFLLVGTAADGEAALALVLERRPELLVTDLRMPRLDGLGLIERIAEALPEEERPLVLILSAHSEFECAQAAVRLGAFDYLLKPLDDDDLAAAMARAREALDRRSRARTGSPESAAAALLAEYAPGEGPRTQAQAYVERAAAEIADRYVSELSAESVAARLGITGGHLARIFKAETGLTFAEYLARYRMTRAAELLADPARRVGEVADLVGYADQRHFSSLFRRYVGLTPTEFREGRAKRG